MNPTETPSTFVPKPNPNSGVSFTDELCTNCGLCCDGSLLDDVELKNEQEALGLELMGLKIDTDDAPALALPCTALNGKRCSIYEHRPNTCRRFECKLLQRTKRGEISVANAKITITKTLKQSAAVKMICREIEGKEGDRSLREVFHATLENHEANKDPYQLLYPKLIKEMDRMDTLVNKHFIDL